MPSRRKNTRPSARQYVPRTPEQEPEQTASVRAFWSGTITFGLVSIPVDLVSATRHEGVAMRMLDKKSGEPLGRQYYCPEHGKPLDSEEIVRGFELDSGDFIVVEDEELEALAPRKSRDIELVRFVDQAAIDPTYFKRGYFLLPAGESSKAYHLLVQTMQESQRAGIATFVMRGKEYLVAILADRGLLRAETLRFQDEVRDVSEAGIGKHKKPAPLRVRQIAKQVEQLTERALDPSELEDPSTENLLELARKKLERDEGVIEVSEPAIAASEEGGKEEGGQVVDLMDLIKQRMGVIARESKQRATARRTKKTSKKPPVSARSRRTSKSTR